MEGHHECLSDIWIILDIKYLVVYLFRKQYIFFACVQQLI